jgi:hypothetical protein
VKISIDQSEKPWEFTRNEQTTSFFGKPKLKEIKETRQAYFVKLFIELTQEEMAIVRTYDLMEMVLLEEPRDLTYCYDQLYISANSLMEQINQEALEDAKRNPLQYKLEQFLASTGFTNRFDSLREANDYIQRLKNDILPKVKRTMEHYGATHRPSSQTGPETFEL